MITDYATTRIRVKYCVANCDSDAADHRMFNHCVGDHRRAFHDAAGEQSPAG